MKTFTLFTLFLILLSTVAFAADIQFVIPSIVVSDVPFPTTVQMKSTDAVARIQIYTTSKDKNILFTSAGQGSWLTGSLLNNNQALNGGQEWWYNIGPKGSVNDQSGNYKHVLVIYGKTIKVDTLKLRNTDNLIAKYPDGSSLSLTVNQLIVNPVLSKCGDGVVGYIDTNQNGVKDANEQVEACDEGVNQGKGGCAVDCTYIQLGYKGSNCGFGSYSCVVSQMPPREFFLAKITALVNGVCYPDNNHPQKLYCNNNGEGITKPDSNNKLSIQQQSYLVAQMATALRDLLLGIK